MREAAATAGVMLVTGDTKVVDRGKADKIFINTSGIGAIPEGINIAPEPCAANDKIILGGAMAVHGIAIMSTREGLEFGVRSRATLRHSMVSSKQSLAANNDVHVLRDPTRGGITSSAN